METWGKKVEMITCFIVLNGVLRMFYKRDHGWQWVIESLSLFLLMLVIVVAVDMFLYQHFSFQNGTQRRSSFSFSLCRGHKQAFVLIWHSFFFLSLHFWDQHYEWKLAIWSSVHVTSVWSNQTTFNRRIPSSTCNTHLALPATHTQLYLQHTPSSSCNTHPVCSKAQNQII